MIMDENESFVVKNMKDAEDAKGQDFKTE